MFDTEENVVNIIYETERLIVRKWEDKDYLDLYEYASDSNVTKFMSWATYSTTNDAVSRINFVKQQYADNVPTVDYCIEVKDLNKVIGSIGIVEYKDKNDGEIEIGYILNSKFHGKEYMTECLLGMFKYIKQNKLAKRIVLKHDTENVKSGNVMKRAGMVFEGVLRKSGTNNYHSRCDIALYSILEEEINL